MASKLPVASGLYNYSRLTAISTNYAKRMNRLSKNIFGEVVRPTSAPSMRVVKMFSEKPLDIRPKIMDYCPRHNETYQFMVQACVTTQRSMRVVKMFSEKPLDLRPEITDYYPRHNETYRLMVHLRELGLFRDEHQDFKDEMKRQRILRGKERPKKGEGKRAKK